MPGAGVDAVFHEFRDGLEGIRLRERKDGDGIPMIADAEFSRDFRFHGMAISQSR